MLKIKRSGKFNTMLNLLVVDDEELENLIEEVIVLFQENPSDTRLHDHALRRRMKGKRAFSITGDVRIVYREIGKNTVRFLDIGTHPQVYPARKVKQ